MQRGDTRRDGKRIGVLVLQDMPSPPGLTCRPPHLGDKPRIARISAAEADAKGKSRNGEDDDENGQVVVAPQLISWYSRGKQTGSCVLDRNCSVTTTADGRLVLQTSRGRELQFRCDDRADLLLWLRAVQLAARPSAPGAPPSPSLAVHLPPSVPALSARLPCAPRDGLDCDALFAPSSPPPPPQLLSKEAIASIDATGFDPQIAVDDMDRVHIGFHSITDGTILHAVGR